MAVVLKRGVHRILGQITAATIWYLVKFSTTTTTTNGSPSTITATTTTWSGGTHCGSDAWEKNEQIEQKDDDDDDDDNKDVDDAEDTGADWFVC